MPAEKIVEKILSDAKLKAKEIEKASKEECNALQKESSKRIDQEKREIIKKANEEGKSIKENYKVLSNLDCKKIKLKAKQDIAFDAKMQASYLLYNMEKGDAVKFITKLTKYADENDTMKVDFKNLSLADIKGIKVVKEKKLKVEKGVERGVIFEGKICDKNFTLDELVSQKYDENSKKCNDILFG